MKQRHLVLLVIVLMITFATAVRAQYHSDEGPTWITNDTNLWIGIIGDHDGFCDNTNAGDQQGFPDVDCHEWTSKSPRSIDQDCGSNSCTVSVTVLCPGVASDNFFWFTFYCTGPVSGPDGGVRAGILDQSTMRKGVICGIGSAHPKTCGCEHDHYDLAANMWYYHLFGSMTQRAPLVFECN